MCPRPNEPSDQTSPTLLKSLHGAPKDSDAWRVFVSRYRPLIERWCRGAGLQESDCHDVTQDVLIRLSKAMQTFEYDTNKSFRAWLKTVTRHAWADWKNQMAVPDVGRGDTAVLQLLHSVEARDDLSNRLEEMYDLELMELAILRVRMSVKPRTWEAFKLTAIDGLTGADVAQQLEMQVAHVYVARSEVKKALQREVIRLESETERQANVGR